MSGVYHMSSLEPPDDADEITRAAESYEASESFLCDALEELSDCGPDEIPADLMSRVAVWYSRTPAYATVIEDAIAGEVRW
jgi:hypothetical protein